MKYSVNDVMEYVKEEDVKFIRLAFLGIDGRMKNASIMPSELKRAFSEGIAFDGSAIEGFEKAERSDLFLFPDPDTLTLLPWRPMHGKVIRLFCDVRYPDGRAYELDARSILKAAAKKAEQMKIKCNFGTEFEFYLFKIDENGNETNEPCDNAGYMDVFPADKGENIRREICLTIEEMGLSPECSHHEEGPGQNEIDFKYADTLSSADHAVIFKNATEAIAYKNGMVASFMPKPIKGKSGSGLHVNVSVESDKDVFEPFAAGVLNRIKDMTFFLNPTENSYDRLGEMKAPSTVSWANENRTTLIRIPATNGQKRFELRSPDGMTNVYLSYALIIYAGLEGVENALKLPDETNKNAADDKAADKLPSTLSEAKEVAFSSEFIKKCLPEKLIRSIK